MNVRSPQNSDGLLSCTLVQVIRLTWDKSARGGELAGLRNGVQLAFSVPDEHLKNGGGFWLAEKQNWSSSDQFSQSFHTQRFRLPLSNSYKYSGLTLENSPQGVNVLYNGDSREMGAPERPFAKSLEIEVGQWGRVIWNGRFSCIDSGVWWYEQVTVNIAHFCGEVDGSVFLKDELVGEINLMKLLR